MALLTDLRHTVNDIESNQWSDDTLNTFLRTALDEINVYAETQYTVEELDLLAETSTRTTVDYKVTILALRLAELLLLQQLLSDPLESAKIVTQDTTYESTGVASRMNAILKSKEKAFDRMLKKWIGLDFAGVASLVPPIEEY